MVYDRYTEHAVPVLMGGVLIEVQRCQRRWEILDAFDGSTEFIRVAGRAPEHYTPVLPVRFFNYPQICVF